MQSSDGLIIADSPRWSRGGEGIQYRVLSTECRVKCKGKGLGVMWKNVRINRFEGEKRKLNNLCNLPRRVGERRVRICHYDELNYFVLTFGV